MNDEERAICERLRLWREETKWTQAQIAEFLGVGRDLVASVEYGRTPLKFGLAIRLSRLLRLNLAWLADGTEPSQLYIRIGPAVSGRAPDNALFSEVFRAHMKASFDQVLKRAREVCGVAGDKMSWKEYEETALPTVGLAGPVDVVGLAAMQLLIPACEKLPHDLLQPFYSALAVTTREFLEAYATEIEAYLKIHGAVPSSALAESKLYVDSPKTPVSLGTVKSEPGNWNALVNRLRRLTVAQGAKAQLARDLDTSRQAVNKWLRGKGAPSADLTLRLLHWVEQAEAKQQSPGSALTPPEQVTRKAKSDERKVKPGRRQR